MSNEEICQAYIDGESGTSIAKRLNKGHSSIYKILKKNNIKTRTLSQSIRRNYIDEEFFDDINSESKAYFLGLLFADGCIRIQGTSYSVIIELHKDDKETLDVFLEEVSPNSKMYEKDRSYRIQFNNKKMVYKLIDLGCVQRKSLILEYPKINLGEFENHFIRGYFDGDGCIYKGGSRGINECKIIFTGTKEFLTSLDKSINKSIDISGKIYQKTSKNTYALYYYNIKKVKEVYKYLYKNSKFYMNRKKKIFDSIFKEERT